LNEAASKVNDEWWIKSDGCDIIDGLTEATRFEWSGDVDLGDGRLQDQYENYMKRINHIQHINHQLSDTKQEQCTIDDLVSVQSECQR
jgi:hypothetical protein